MFEFFFFMLIILGFMGGAGVLYVLLNRLTRRVEDGQDPNLSLLRDELDSLTVRLGRVEEELEFYKKLNAPDLTNPKRALPGPEDSAQDRTEGVNPRKESLP
jgi:hypothetical protein